MSNPVNKESFKQGLEALHSNGNEWASLPDVVRLIKCLDDSYMKRRALINNILKVVGIQRDALPNGYEGFGRTIQVATALEFSGEVESTVEYTGDENVPGQKLYRLPHTVDSQQAA